MRTTLLMAFVAGAGIAAAAVTLRTSSAVRAAGSAPTPIFGDMSQLMKDPVYREQKRAEISAKLTETGDEVASEVGLTTSQLRQLIDLETNFQMGVFDTFVPAPPLGQRMDPAKSSAAVEQQKELRSELDTEIVTLLGVEKAQRLKDYVKSQPARRQVKQLQVSLVAEGSPMTADQQRSLIATMTSEQERRDSEVAAYHAKLKNDGRTNKTVYDTISGELDIDEQANARIVQTATPDLSPTQLSSLQKMLADPIPRGRLHLQAHASTP
jgi:hypothetical protein